MASVSVTPTVGLGSYTVDFLDATEDPAIQLRCQIVKRWLLEDGTCLRTDSLGEVKLDNSEVRAFPQYTSLRDFLHTALLTKAQALL